MATITPVLTYKPVPTRDYSGSPEFMVNVPIYKVVVVKDTRTKRPSPLDVTYMSITRSMESAEKLGTKANGPYGPIRRFLAYSSRESSSANTDAANQKNSVIAQARSRLANPTWNAANDLGELGQTGKMVANRLGKPLAVLAALSSRDAVTAARIAGANISTSAAKRINRLPASKRAASFHLEVQYGWLPLMSSVYDALEFFRGKVATTGMRVTASAGKRHRAAYKAFAPASGPLGFDNMASYANMSGSVYSPTIRTLSELGLLNPASLAWELTPFSFVVDWFTCIGDVIMGLTAGLGLKKVRSYTISERRSNVESRTIGLGLAGWFHYYSVQTIYRRDATFTFPELNTAPVTVSFRQAINSAALIRQRLR